jgi:hypothetical protein
MRLEVVSFHTPENNVWDMGEFMLTVSEAAKERDWMCYLVGEARRVSTTLRHMLTEFSEFFHLNVLVC